MQTKIKHETNTECKKANKDTSQNLNKKSLSKWIQINSIMLPILHCSLLIIECATITSRF